MLLVSLVTMLVGVAPVVTLSPSLRFVLDLSCEELLMCVQVGLVVYAIIFDLVFISHGSVFCSLARYARAALSTLRVALIWLLSPAEFVYRVVYGIKAVRVVVCFLLVFIFCLVKLVVVSILKGSAFVLRRAIWLFFRRVVAPCILFALFAPIRLTCAACVHGCVIVATLWMETTAFLLCVPLRWLTRLCEPWSVPPGSFVFVTSETMIWHDKRARRFRVFTSGKHGKSNIKLSIKHSLLRHEKYWDALEDLLGCMEQFTTTNDVRLESDSKDSHDTTSSVLESCTGLGAVVAAPLDTFELATPTSNVVVTGNKNGPTECDRATSTTCTAKSIFGGQPEIASKGPKLVVARASLSSVLTDTSFESSLFDQDTTTNTSLTSTSAPLSSTLSLAGLAVGDGNKARSEPLSGSEPQVADKLESPVESQIAADSNLIPKPDAPIPSPKAPAEPKSERKLVNKWKSPVKSRPLAPRKFKLPAKFSLSMSCDLFKPKATPRPKSLNELPVQPQSSSGVILCSCGSNRDALSLTVQMENLKLCSHKPKSETQETSKDVETLAMESATESKVCNTAEVGVQTVTSGIETTNSDAQVTEKKVDVPCIVVTVEDEADAFTTKTADTAATYTAPAGTPACNMPTAFEGPLGVPSSTIGNTQAAPPATGSDYISPFDAFLSEGPMVDLPGLDSNSQVGGSGVSFPPYFGQPSYPGVNVAGMQPELGFPGAPMMGGIPNVVPNFGNIPGMNLSLDFLAELPKVDLPFKLDDETLALLGDCDDFVGTLNGLWNGGSRGQSFSRSGAPSPELPPSDPVANAAELDAAQALLSSGTAPWTAQEMAAAGGEQVGGEVENVQEEEEVEAEEKAEEISKPRRLAGKIAARLARGVRAGKAAA